MRGNDETLLREVLAQTAGIERSIEELSRRLDETQVDARHARDLGNKISTILEEQNLVTRFSEHKSDVRQMLSEIRQDFVHANTSIRTEQSLAVDKLRGEINGLDARLDALEAARQQVSGAKSLVAWVAEKAPWLLAAAGAAAAFTGWGDKLK